MIFDFIFFIIKLLEISFKLRFFKLILIYLILLLLII